ncbi:hypothetical protein Tco_1350956, partial [Tanacetum coccineum]
FERISWPLVSAVLSQMAHLVASITLNSTRSGSIRFDSFLPSVLLWLVIIVVVVGVGVMVVVVVVFEALGNPPMKASRSFSVFGWAYAFHQDKASSVRVPVANVTLFSSAHLLRENTDSVRVLVGPVFLLGLLVPVIVAACASRAAVTLSVTSFLMAA